ncbi:DUF393 domain-containing protein [Pontibacterium sp. N1Y112]|uniref:DUF393 domain-containing protein n=1 Tax=Pontibacterium sinense TaxID=2781979 RepID=A0A8J7JY80_9GAMM|nr:DUF393 domain-containing protein [Pontibacterium sinense]MBE9396149.1 DUF393 domain-containing protein [Pontibacterium sinense]
MKPEVFYDGDCPLCRKEINHYIRLDTDQRVNWRNIWQERDNLAKRGIEFSDAMKWLHTTDHNGDLHRGVYSFVVIWRELPYYRWLARVVVGLKLIGLMDIVYQRFARRRFRSRCKEGCQIPD